MLQIIIGGFLLSALHALIPNHWLPIVVIGKGEGWTRRETLVTTSLVATAHTLGTILLGIIVGLIGHELSEKCESVSRFIAPIILGTIGCIYLLRKGECDHHHGMPVSDRPAVSKKSRWALTASLCIAMSVTPCFMGIGAYFFTAGSQAGWYGIGVLSIVYLFISVGGMMALVDLTLHGVERIKWHFLEHHENKILGFILLALAVSTLIFGFHHAHEVCTQCVE
ncbi:hypothetical protein KDK77_01625 [bacterium]|nr:hypothetical protein [bacterium]